MANLCLGWELRPAIYRSRFDRPDLGITKGTETRCLVWGCYQVMDESEASPYFVVELMDGRCMYAAPEDLRFTGVGGVENATCGS